MAANSKQKQPEETNGVIHKMMECDGTSARPSVVDGPYSWVIMVIAFLMNLTMNAGAGGMGVIMVELMHHFKVKRSVIFWIGGILVSVGFILSFLIGWLIKRFGCRVTGIVASLCASTSLILASVSQSIAMLYVTYGFMFGISLAFHWNIASVIIQQYFEKRRTLAQGTLMSGLSGGLFLWPPVTRYMMDIYGWRGAMLLHAGIQLHGVVLCALIRPLPAESKNMQQSQISRPIYKNQSGSQMPTGDYQDLSNDDKVPKIEPDSINRPNGGGVESDTKTSDRMEPDAKDKGEESSKMLQNSNSKEENREFNMELRQQNDLSIKGQEESSTFLLNTEGNSHITNPVDNSGNNSAGCTGGRCFRALFKVLILYPHYILYIMAVTLTQTGNVMPYTLTPARADALGIDKHWGALLVTISAGVSGISRILCGLIADHPAINRLVLCGVAGLTAGILTAASTALETFVSLAVTFAIIGVPSAAFMATFGSAAVDIVGKKYVSQAIGLMSMGFGLAQLSTFLGTGWLSDLLGDPKYGFLVFGVLEACGGIMFLGVYLVDKRLRQKLATRDCRSKLNSQDL